MSWNTDIAKRNVIASRKAREITKDAARDLWKELADAKYADPARPPEDKNDDFYKVQQRLQGPRAINVKRVADLSSDEVLVRVVKQNTLRDYVFKELMSAPEIDNIFARKDSYLDLAKNLLNSLPGSGNYLTIDDPHKIKGSFAARRDPAPSPDVFASTDCWCWPRLLAIRDAKPRNRYWAVQFRASAGSFREATVLDGDGFYWRQGGRTCVPSHDDPDVAGCGVCSGGVCGAVRGHPRGVREVIAIGIKVEAIEITPATSIYDVLRECRHP